jgi:hypothetical protein
MFQIIVTAEDGVIVRPSVRTIHYETAKQISIKFGVRNFQ